MMIRILIVDEAALLSEVMTAVLEGEDDMRVLGCITSTPQLRGALEKNTVDVVLISASLNQSEVFEMIHVVADYSKKTKVLVTGMPDSEEHILAFIECGAHGYVLREDSVDTLLTNIRNVHERGAQLSGDHVESLMQRVRELSTFCKEMLTNLDAVNLTDREMEVLASVAEKKSNADIADALGIEIGTVKSHVHSILQKLNVNNRQEAARYYPLMKHASESIITKE